MEFRKKFMRKNELIRDGFPRQTLDRIWNTKGQNIAFKADAHKRNSPIIYNTVNLARFLDNETACLEVERRLW